MFTTRMPEFCDMKASEETVFADYLQQFTLGIENPSISVVQFLLNHPPSREKFEQWMRIGKKQAWRGEPNGISATTSELSSKVSEKALALRKEGSSHFAQAGSHSHRNEALGKALQCYNEALLHSHVAQDAGRTALESTAILFANRSAVFFEMTRYEEALKDIEVALKLGYPSDLRWKVWIRKGKILMIMKQFLNVLGLLDSIEVGIGSSVQSSNRLSSTLQYLRKSAERGLADGGNEADPEEIQELPKRCQPNINAQYKENPDFEYGSSALRIRYTPEGQRCVLTVADVRFGEVLFNEVPYASVLLPHYASTHCHHCHAHMRSSKFPCRSCSEVAYCCEECSVQSWFDYHQFECHHLELLHSVGLGHLAARIVLTAGPRQILETLDLESILDEPQSTIGLYGKGGSKYQRVFALLHHTSDFNPMDYFQYAQVSAFLTLWLKEKTTYFAEASSEDIPRIGRVILRHFCQLICNAQRVYGFPTTTDGEVLRHEERISIGSAIFTSTSLMNHTCDPKISTNYKFECGKGRQFIVKATEDIPSGSVVENSYGLTYRRNDLSSRQQNLLQQYFFKCTCDRCDQETRIGRSFVEEFSSIQCQNCHGAIYAEPLLRRGISTEICILCKSVQELKPAQDAWRLSVELNDSGLEAVVQENWDVGLKYLRWSYKLRRKFLYRTHSLLAESWDSLARLHNAMGQHEKALRYLKKSLDHVSIRFGNHSNEYARELEKYVDLLVVLGIDQTEDGDQRKELTERLNELTEAYSPLTPAPYRC